MPGCGAKIFTRDPFTGVTEAAINYTNYQTSPYTSYLTYNYTTMPAPALLPEFVVMIPMIIMTITAMYGNAVVIYTLTSLQTRSQHLTIMLSLACSDMITSSVLMPCIALSSVTHEAISPKWCFIFPYLAYTVFYTSFGHLGFISIEQCYRIWNFSSYKKRMTPHFVKCVCVFIWLFAATAFIYPIQRIMRPVYAKTHFLCVFTPKVGIGNIKTARFVLYGLTMVYRAMILLILLVCYFLIFLKMYLKTRNRDSESLMQNKTNKSVLIMLAVIVVFFFSWFPDFLVQLLNMVKVMNGAPMWLSRFIMYNYYISPVFNPLIYTIGYKHVRKQMLATITVGGKENKFYEPEEFPPLTYVDRSKKVYRRESAIEQIEVIDQIAEENMSIEIEDPELEQIVIEGCEDQYPHYEAVANH